MAEECTQDVPEPLRGVGPASGLDDDGVAGGVHGQRRDIELSLALPHRVDLAAVDVSVEQDGRPAAHSGTSLAGGAFE